MDGAFEFILERYNYWIVIVLMMTGLYIVFARGNLVKKVVGLNLFQTSVFIFYITIGKIAGGTAPIYIGKDLKKMKEGAHGDGHGEDHGSDSLHEVGDAHSKVENTLVDAQNHINDKIANLPANDLAALKDAAEQASEGAQHGGDASLHVAPEAADKIANPPIGKMGHDAEESSGFDIAEGDAAADHASEGAYGAADAAYGVGEIIYTNPLPHVLILTAIVVGVATTAVGLALAVRVREAYGTIEEDELEAIDNVAEYGEDAETAAGASVGAAA